jgi:hypothetical protein
VPAAAHSLQPHTSPHVLSPHLFFLPHPAPLDSPLCAPQILEGSDGKPAASSPLPGEPRPEPHPYYLGKEEAGFPDGDPAPRAFRYRKWKLPGDISLVARTTVHAVSRKGGVPKFVSAFALNEWDPKLSGACGRVWRGGLPGGDGAT